MSRRWENYVLHSGHDSAAFWNEFLAQRERRVLYVMGQGFDPRMCLGLDMLLSQGGAGERDVLLIAYQGQEHLTDLEREAIRRNRAFLDGLAAGRGSVFEVGIRLRDERRRFVGADEIAAQLRSWDFSSYNDVIIDVSSTPRTVALTALATVLNQSDRMRSSGNAAPNVHVISTESMGVDSAISQIGIDDTVTMLPYFVAEIDSESSAEQPRVWFPILGEGKADRLTTLHDFIRPSEISPVLPSPTLNPYRGDRLIAEYRKILFDELQVDARNFVYAAENNPFECYRQLHHSIKAYSETLNILGGCKPIISPLSSRLLSVGAFLAAYELREEGIKVGLAYLETHNYGLQDVDMSKVDCTIHTLCIAGEVYA